MAWRRSKKRENRVLLSRVFAGAAVICLVGGLGLAYVKDAKITRGQQRTNNQPGLSETQQLNDVNQTTTGNGSPAIQGVQGNVTVRTDQTPAKTESRKSKPDGSPPKKDE